MFISEFTLNLFKHKHITLELRRKKYKLVGIKKSHHISYNKYTSQLGELTSQTCFILPSKGTLKKSHIRQVVAEYRFNNIK